MDLAPFGSVDASSLRWLRGNVSPLEFALLAGDTGVAGLVWNGPTGSLATARTSASSWTLKRAGFLNPHVSVRAEGTRTETARLTVHWTYHRLEIEGGPAFRFHRAGVLLPAWKVTDEAGQELVHIEPVREGRKLVGGAVVTSPAGLDRPELPLLLLVSWYFIVLAWFEDEALVPLEGPDAPTATPGAPRTT